MSDEPSWLPFLLAAQGCEPELWRAYSEAARLPSRRVVARFSLYHDESEAGHAPVLPHRSPHEIARAQLAKALRRRLCSGELVARGRYGSPLAPVVAIPPDAWQYLRLLLEKSAARTGGGSTVYGVEVAHMSVPTIEAGRNRSEQEKSNEINDVPTVPTVPTDKHKCPGPDGGSPAGPVLNSNVSEEEIVAYLDRAYGPGGPMPGRDDCFAAIRLHFAGRHVDRGLFRRLQSGRLPPGRPKARGTTATVQRQGEP